MNSRPVINANVSSETTTRNLPEFDGHEFVMTLSDMRTGLKAYIAIHNTNRGIALGGTRYMNYDSEGAATKDVLQLSRAMSYKCALANLPYGGGKAVIMSPADSSKRSDQLLAYARLIQQLNGLFKTGTDVGISDEDVKLMAQKTDYMLGVTPADRGDLSTASVAALGVFHAIRATLSHLYKDASLQGRTVAIKGVGKLGGELAKLVTEDGGSVLISDVNNTQTAALRAKLPRTTVVDNSTIQRAEVDIYAPCALGNEFTEQSITELRCKGIAGGANNQLMSDVAGDMLHELGILYAPDYIANAGGLIYVADELEPAGFNKDRVLERTRAIEQTLDEIFSEAVHRKIPTHKMADMLAAERIWGKSNA